MDLFLDSIPPSGQQATQQQKQTIVTPSPPDRPTAPNNNDQRKPRGWHPPTPDLFPSPSTELTSSGRERVQSWTSTFGESPRAAMSSAAAGSAQQQHKKPRMGEIRKISDVQPEQLPADLTAQSHAIKRQANGLALPQKIIFDPWNACTTGHQRAENRLYGSTSWRESREKKLKVQFADTSGSGGRRMYDTVGAGSVDFGKDGRKENGGWEKGAPGLRKDGQQSIVDCFREDHGKNYQALPIETKAEPAHPIIKTSSLAHNFIPSTQAAVAPTTPTDPSMCIQPSLNAPTSTIFHNTCIYINGSTYPLISDHVLRQLIVRHGGALSIALARRSVSHVILTHKPAPDRRVSPAPGASASASLAAPALARQATAGGGLAATKVRKEVERRRNVGSGVKYVTAHWVIESIRAGRRLPEGRFADWRFVERGQEDVRDFFAVGKGVARDDEYTKDTK